MSKDITEIAKVEVLPQIADGGAIERAVIDCQIATAHQYPRSMQDFKQRALSMVTLDEETAASCIYRRNVGGGKFAEGKSIRMAEIVGACYGNFRVVAQIVEQTERYVKARGMAHDLETNFASASEVIESTVKADGTPYGERMRIVVAKAAVAKARRDATFQVIPAALCKALEDSARNTAIGKGETLERRRAKVVGWIAKLGVEASRVYTALGIKGEDDLGLDELETLTGIRTAIIDGDSTIDESFPAFIPDSPAPTQGKSVKKAAKTKTDKKAPVAGEDTGDDKKKVVEPPVAEPEQEQANSKPEDDDATGDTPPDSTEDPVVEDNTPPKKEEPEQKPKATTKKKAAEGKLGKASEGSLTAPAKKRTLNDPDE